MAALNYYYGLKRGQVTADQKVVVGPASNGVSADVEVRVQINNGTNATGITQQDVRLALETIQRIILARLTGSPTAQPDVPAL